MADGGTLVLGAAVLGIAGFAAYKAGVLGGAPAPAPAPASSGPATNSVKGYTIPSDLLQQMQSAYYLYGSPGTNSQQWIAAMTTILPASAQSWSYVYNQWRGVHDGTNGWPSQTQLVGWLTDGINLYG